MESSGKDWQNTKNYLIRQLFDIPKLSPVIEETETQDAPPSPPSLLEYIAMDGQNLNNTGENNNKNSSESSVSSYPDLIIERESNRHDEPEEYYKGLMVRMHNLYKTMFSESCDEHSLRELASNPYLRSFSGYDTLLKLITNKTVDDDKPQRLCSYSPESNEQIKDKSTENLINASVEKDVSSKDNSTENLINASVEKDVSSSPILPKRRRPDTPESIELMRRASVDSLLHTTRDSLHEIALSQDKSAGTLSLEHERELISFNAELSNELPSLNIITSTPTQYVDMEVSQKLDLSDDDGEQRNKSKEDARAVKRKCCADFTSQTSFEESTENVVSWDVLKQSLFVGIPTIINISRQ